MNYRHPAFPVLLLTLALAGCSGKPAAKAEGPYGGHTANWYLKHPQEMKAEGAWCASQSLKVQQGASCMSVAAAQNKRFIENSKHTKDLF
jgi:hypothetical protein